MEATDDSPSLAEIYGSSYSKIAESNWGLHSRVKFSTKVVTTIYDLLSKDDFSEKSLLTLDSLLYLEKYLWPNWNSNSKDDHAISVVLTTVIKKKEGLVDWNLFETRPDDFGSLFQRILMLSSVPTTPIKIRSYIILFVDLAFQSLDSMLVRRQCAPLVSIGIISCLHSIGARNSFFAKYPSLKKPWKSSNKRFESAEESQKVRYRLERGWLFSIIVDTIQMLYIKEQSRYQALTIYVERVIELLVDITSQLPTRKFTNTLLKDLNFSVVAKLSPYYISTADSQFRKLLDILEHYMFMLVDDVTGVVVTQEEFQRENVKMVLRFQKHVLDTYKDKLMVLALANYGSVVNKSDLIENLEPLTEDELKDECRFLDLNYEYSIEGVTINRDFLLNLVASRFIRPTIFENKIINLNCLPTEISLSDPIIEKTFSNDSLQPIALPRLTLQYLSVKDFLYRTFELHRLESFYGIKSDLEAIVQRLKLVPNSRELKVGGSSRMAQKISQPSILDVGPARVGENHPSMVLAEIYLELDTVKPDILAEWDALRPGDVVFLICLQSPDAKAATELEKIGIKYVRAAELVNIYDHNYKHLYSYRKDDESNSSNLLSSGNNSSKVLHGRLAKRRRLQVNIDPLTYKADPPSVYQKINFIFRRRQRENNFKAILDCIKELMMRNNALPDWLTDVFMGYGDPKSASYENLPNKIDKLDMNDTFLNFGHLKSSFPDKRVVFTDGDGEGALPPYIIREALVEIEERAKKRGKSSKSENHVESKEKEEVVEVSTYKLPNMGPYHADSRKLNRLPFTPAQVKAVYSGTQPGLTLIIGPPGTGKTDVATQIISNIYHDFPDQKTLVVSHSNQALNRLFEKIAALDVDERHLLRLGHGEDELRMETSFSRYGMVDNLMEKKRSLLASVDNLAESIGALGAHGDTCETAEYFFRMYVKPLWSKFREKEYSSVEDIDNNFPFHSFFSDAPQPLLNSKTHSVEEALEIVDGCYRHIEQIFIQLEDMRPFELLRTQKHRANYFLVKEAKIVALTATHAAMRHKELVSLGFHYHNVVCEEAAQLTEIESFIPMTLQSTTNINSGLQRVVLIGDPFQNAPIIQNIKFRQYSNLDQSLFQRLLRLGVPRICLNAQGRARPEIADIYSWRYDSSQMNGLINLPRCYEMDEYKKANAGFKFTFQFVNVDDFNGNGESEPSSHFFQNLGEAEYAVELYMYMRLLGYPSSSISILTTYFGQKILIQDILDERCKRNPIFGMPAAVATVDQYQGEQNDYIILSLVRTKRIGYLRDIRRLTVAFSRARLGLYVFGRRRVMNLSLSSLNFLNKLDVNKSDNYKLELYVGEMFPSVRNATDIDPSKVVVMENVEHLGKYVYEMTMKKIEKLKEEGSLPKSVINNLKNNGEDCEYQDQDNTTVGGS
ncbi:P-loop containing nucleoside triphosphate hydrolase protein [Dipodascopsis uninucleata]